MRKYVLAATLLSVFAIACNKEKNMKNATVIDTGDIASGGCGYLLRLEDENRDVRPVYLPSAFQYNGYKVKVKINTNGEQQVCLTHPINKVYEVVEIADIRRNLD